jgi:hypothetical protein
MKFVIDACSLCRLFTLLWIIVVSSRICAGIDLNENDVSTATAILDSGVRIDYAARCADADGKLESGFLLVSTPFVPAELRDAILVVGGLWKGASLSVPYCVVSPSGAYLSPGLRDLDFDDADLYFREFLKVVSSDLGLRNPEIYVVGVGRLDGEDAFHMVLAAPELIRSVFVYCPSSPSSLIDDVVRSSSAEISLLLSEVESSEIESHVEELGLSLDRVNVVRLPTPTLLQGGLAASIPYVVDMVNTRASASSNSNCTAERGGEISTDPEIE